MTFTFRARARGQALATARVSAATPLTLDPCRSASLSIGGRTQLGLLDARVLLDRADALLDTSLVTRP